MSGELRYYYNAFLIDGSGQTVSEEPAAMVVEGRHIRAVDLQSRLACPEQAEKIDLHGLTLMPGMADCHDHLADLEGGMQQRAGIPPSLAVFLTAEAFKNTLSGGFTAIRDASGVDLGMKMAVERGLIPGPRLKISVVILSQFGGHNDHTEAAGINSHFPWLQSIPSGICDGVDECRKKTREVIRAGADWVKIATTGGVGTPIGGPLIRQFSPEEVQVITDTAHAAGKPVMSHAYGGEGVKICLDAGVDSIEHGAALDDTLIEQMVKQGTWLVPTFTVLRRVIAISEQNPLILPEYMPRKARMLLEHQAISFRNALHAGVKIALGTDGGGFGHGHNAGELHYLVEAGMTPMQALVAATRMGTTCMGLGDETGVLRAGMLADFLVVDGNPLNEVRILEDRQRLRLIVKDGMIYKDTLSALEQKL
ncbi:MAG: amidohydrolase family protein [Anaerolineaceae bacterium]|jgi:imidazolonepropionase-like amidohydrolase